MVNLEYTADSLIIHVQGLDKVLAMKSSLEVPLAHVQDVHLGVDGDAREALSSSVRVGANLPGMVIAGRFYSHGKVAFWDVHNEANAITIRVNHDDYTHLVVEVANPAAAVQELKAKLGKG